MTDPTIAQSVLFPDLFDKPLVATFDREQSSSDGGAVLLKAAERVYPGKFVRLSNRSQAGPDRRAKDVFGRGAW